MSEIQVSKIPEEREKTEKKLSKKYTFFTVSSFIAAILVILFMIGFVVVVFLFEFGKTSMTLSLILMGVLAAMSVIGAFGADFFLRASKRAENDRLDYLERCDSPFSFFVGEGTLATFEESGLYLHTAEKGKREIVPYSRMRFFSVCTRTAPREKGEWSVVMEIPACYVMKAEKLSKDAQPILAQTDAKPRLYEALKTRGLTLLGELPQEEEKKKFTVEKKFYLPDRKQRKRALLFLILGAALICASIPVGIVWNATVGAILAVFGLFLAGRFTYTYLRAKSLFAVYHEGIFWRASGKPDSLFLKWEEIERISSEEVDTVSVSCAYGAYRFPKVDGALEYLAETHPEKTEKKEDV